jgi:eukaryotic-like serine/threonine-protein kinase
VVAGRYRLDSVLGSGGVGRVWLAVDELLSRQVAVKEFSPPAELGEAERTMLLQRTLHEAKTAARLSHPNVVTIYDAVEDAGRPWIVMQLIPAQSLRDLVRDQGPLEPHQAASIGLQVLAALRAAHALGITHRDVKPANVLIDSAGRAVLADFGIARGPDSPTLTRTGMLVGSPSYIAPERAHGDHGGPESDLWSLGATLYAAVEGRPPYDRKTPLATLTAVVNEDPDPPRRCAELWPVVSGLLAQNPARRLRAATAEQMLRRVAGPAEAWPPESSPHTLPFPEISRGPDRDPGRSGTRELPLPFTVPDQPLPAEPGHTEPGEVEPGEVEPAQDEPADTGPGPSEPGSAEPVPAESAPAEPAPAEPAPTEPAPTDVHPAEPAPAESVPTDVHPAEPASGEPVTVADPQPSGLVAEELASAGQDPETAADDEPAPAKPAAISPIPAKPAAISPVPAEPARAEPGQAGEAPRRPWVGRSRRQWLIAAIIVAAAAAVITAIVVALSTSTRQQPSPGARTPPGSSAASPSSSAASARPTASASGTALPRGFHRYQDPTGFSIAVPAGWRISHQGHLVYLTPPAGGAFLLIDQSDHPKPNPLADWQQQEAARASSYPGYHRIRLAAVSYPPAEKAADWEFTYFHQGVLTHVLNRNVLANAHHAYALYWSTPASQWNQDRHIFTILARTFQPAR